MHRILPPVCFLLAMAMIAVAFGMLALGAPEASVALHQARASGDETFIDAFESDLKLQLFLRWGSLVTLFVGSVFITIVGFRAMKRR